MADDASITTDEVTDTFQEKINNKYLQTVEVILAQDQLSVTKVHKPLFNFSLTPTLSKIENKNKITHILKHNS